MRKQVVGRRRKRDMDERKALFKGLVSAMILRGKIKTTEAKAKAIKPDLEKMVTQNGPGFKNRAGGYTRIIKTGTRLSDNASMALIQWSEMEEIEIKNQKS